MITSARLSEINEEITYLLRCGNNSAENAIKWADLQREREQLKNCSHVMHDGVKKEILRFLNTDYIIVELIPKTYTYNREAVLKTDCIFL